MEYLHACADIQEQMLRTIGARTRAIPACGTRCIVS
jgi:hypothetical protein